MAMPVVRGAWRQGRQDVGRMSSASHPLDPGAFPPADPTGLYKTNAMFPGRAGRLPVAPGAGAQPAPLDPGQGWPASLSRRRSTPRGFGRPALRPAGTISGRGPRGVWRNAERSIYMGEVAELSRRLPVLLAEAQERGDRFALTNLKTYLLSFLRLAADDPERARRESYEALGEWSQQGFHVQHMTGLFAQVHIDLYCRQGQAAWQHITEQWPAAKRSLVLRVQRLRVYYRYQHACFSASCGEVAR